MHTPLQRLYHTKLALVATVSTTLGVALLVLVRWPGLSWSWLHALPVADIGSALFTSGLIIIAFEYLDQQDSDARANERLRKVLKEEAPAIRDAVIQGFAFTPDDLARVASPATMDQIAENTLALQLGDRGLAREVYADLRQQVIRSPERRYSAVVSVDLAPWNNKAASSEADMFVATVRWEYRVQPATSLMRFACVSDLDTLRELRDDPTSALVWYFKPVGDLHGGSNEAFELLQFAVDGKPRPIRRTGRARSQTYTVNLSSGKGADNVGAPTLSPGQVTISYSYKVLVRRHGHLFSLGVGALTKGIKIAFRYGGCGIREVNTRDFIASSANTRVTQTPASVLVPAVEVSFDGWVMSRSGVVFSWILSDDSTEVARQ